MLAVFLLGLDHDFKLLLYLLLMPLRVERGL